MTQRPLWLIAAPVVFLILWSAGFGVAKIAVSHAAPLTVLALRYCLVLLLLIPVALVLLTELGAGNLDDRDAMHVVPALCGPEGEALDEAALERALRDASELSVAARPLHLQGSTVPLVRLSVDQLAAAFGFVPVPQAD